MKLFNLFAAVLLQNAQVTIAIAPDNIAGDMTAGGFSAIVGDFSRVSSLAIDPRCPNHARRSSTYPSPTFTIQPSTFPFVSTYPANLVTAVVSGGTLRFEYNEQLLDDRHVGGSGVRVGLPPDQFKSLYLARSIHAQILNGFTSVEKLTVHGAAKIHADLLSSSTKSLEMSVAGASSVDVISNIIESATVSGASKVNIQASFVTSVLLQGASKLSIDGNLGGSSLSGASKLRVTGDIQGHVHMTGASNIEANTISGSISGSGASSVRATSCRNVYLDWSSCKVGSSPSVGVDVSPFDAISSRRIDGYWCNGSVDWLWWPRHWYNPKDHNYQRWFSNGAYSDSQYVYLIAVTMTFAVVITYFRQRSRRRGYNRLY